MSARQHFIAGKRFVGKESGKEIVWHQEKDGLYLSFEDQKVRKKIKAPEIGDDDSLEKIYNIFADWTVCDFLEEQEFQAFVESLKEKR